MTADLSSGSRSRRLSSVPFSIDLDSDIPESKKQRLDWSRNRKESSGSDTDTLFEGNSKGGILLGTKSDNDRKFMNTMDKNNDIKSKDRTSRWKKYMQKYSESVANVQNLKKNENKHYRSYENSVMVYDSNKSSCDTCASLYRAKETFLKGLGNHKSKTNKNKPVKYSQRSYNTSGKQSYNNSNQVIGRSKKRCEEPRRKKQGTGTNFKPEITRMAGDLITMFSKFTSQINQLQLKYLEQDVVTWQDAGDTIFIINCIISKLKKELTKKQQDLTNAYTHWSSLYRPDRIVSNVQYKQCNNNNNNNLQLQNQECSDCSTDTEIFSANFHKTQSYKATESSKKKVQGNNKNKNLSSHQQNSRNDEEGSSSETTDMYLSSAEKKRNGASRGKKSAFVKLAKLPEINFTRLSSQSSTMNYKPKNKHLSNAGTSNKNFVRGPEQQVQKVHNSPKKEPIKAIEHLTDGDSDVSSTCSTMVLYPATCPSMNHHRGDERNSINISEDDLDSSVSGRPSLTVELNDTGEESALCHFDSDATVILPQNMMTNSGMQNLQGERDNPYQPAVEKNDVVPKNKNFVSKQESKYIVHDTEDVKHCSGADYCVDSEDSDSSKSSVSEVECITIDKRLRAKRQLLLDKINH